MDQLRVTETKKLRITALVVVSSSNEYQQNNNTTMTHANWVSGINGRQVLATL